MWQVCNGSWKLLSPIYSHIAPILVGYPFHLSLITSPLRHHSTSRGINLGAPAQNGDVENAARSLTKELGRVQQIFDDAGRIQRHGLYEQCTSIAGGIMSRPARYRWSGGAPAQHLLPMYHKVSYIPIFYKRYSKVRAWYSPIQWLETHCWWWCFLHLERKAVRPCQSPPSSIASHLIQH